VVDDAGAVVEPGIAGEVAVTSRFMFDGYWGHPELNRQVLTDVRDRDEPEWRYRTGDLGRVDASGALTLLGRSDTKVKVRGRFVVLGDVEADLHELDQVLDAVTVARSVDGVVELVAYVVPAEPTSFVSADVRAQLLERREAFRVPSRWVLLDELPRLPNGKVDRRALPDPELVTGEQSERATGATGSPDRSDLRGQVRSLWERLLPVGRVGDDEDFFELGGDSLVKAIATTKFQDGGLPIVANDGSCYMHRQASFYAGLWPEGTKIGADGDVNVFYLPSPAGGPKCAAPTHPRRRLRPSAPPHIRGARRDVHEVRSAHRFGAGRVR
jgi:hypothetical protein